MKNIRLGLIGAGNMGTSILEGALKKKVINPSQVSVYDKIKARSGEFSRKTGAHAAKDLKELFSKSDLILLAMKPQDFAEFAGENKKYFHKSSRVISILAGLTISKIRRALGVTGVVRAMPNLGAKAGASMTVIAGNDKKLIRLAAEVFNGCGETAVLPEKTFDHVTALSGSGPAYFFYLMELMTDYGVKQGIPPRVAAQLAVQTALGAAQVAKGAVIPVCKLRKMVTSKKGTTEAALTTLKRKRFGKIFYLGLHAAARRSRQLRK